MNRWRRRLSRIILFSFALRALVPMGLMLQLPLVSADITFQGANSLSEVASRSLGFVICPLQNPGIDLGVLVDSNQPAAQHAHHHHKGHADASGDDTSNTISVDRGASHCNLWSSSADSNLLLTGFASTDFEAGIQPPLTPTVSDYQSNHFPRRLTRAPPKNL